jgi:type IV pilus assembly protein PilV
MIAGRKLLASRYRAAGFTLIEVLVALVVLSIGLLGVAGLQIVGLRGNLSAASRTQASYLAEDIIDRMRANYTAARGPAGAGHLQYQLTMGATAPTATDATAISDVTTWLTELQTLPSGKGSINVDAVTSVVTVTIQWLDTPGGDSNLCTGTNLQNCVPMTFQTQTQL